METSIMILTEHFG